MTRRVCYTKRADRDLENVPDPDRRSIVVAVRAFAAGTPADVRMLTGHRGLYRLRVGRWRVFYELPAGEVLVLRIRDRKNAYR
ncbi:MAG: type II toxin-antitoxin system RelE family toxin [Vulcanimicrobiaceae bacterium]